MNLLQHLKKQQEEDLKLLKEYEEEKRCATNPREKRKCSNNIQELKRQISDRAVEIAKLEDSSSSTQVSKQKKTQNSSFMQSPNGSNPKLIGCSVVLGLLLIAGTGVGAVKIAPKIFFSLPSQNPQFQNVNITVRDRESDKGLQNVEVEFSYQGAPTLKETDNNGYVSLEIPERGDITVYLNKEGYKSGKFTINLQAERNRTRDVYLEKESFQPEHTPPSPGTTTPEPNPTPTLTPPGGLSPSRSKTPSSNPENIGELQGTHIFEDRLTTEKQKQCYHFSLSQSTNASFYVDRVADGAKVYTNLAVDTNNNGIVDSGENQDSNTPYGGGSMTSMHQWLDTDPYIFCVEFNNRNTGYRLQLVNNLSEMKQLTTSVPQSGSLSDTNVQDYYQFTLDRPQSVSLVVSNITESIYVELFADNNTNGSIDSSESEDSTTAYPSNGGKIEKVLSAGTYWAVLSRRQEKNTDYSLTLSSQ